MLKTLLFLGLSAVQNDDINKGDIVVKAQMELMKLTYQCDASVYRITKDSTRRWVARLDGDTSYKTRDVSDLDRSLKAGKIKLEAIDKSDCDNLIADARERVDEVFEEYNR